MDLEKQAERLESQWNQGQASDEETTLLLILLQKLARSSPSSFKKYWFKVCSLGKEVIASERLSPVTKGAAYHVLALDSLFHFDVSLALKHAEDASQFGFDPAKYCYTVAKHLADKSIRLSEENLSEVVLQIEECLLDRIKDNSVAYHQCYVFALHLGLMYDQGVLIVKAEDYLAQLSG